MDTRAQSVVVMGVMGVGKSTVGQALAPLLNARFLDADAFHSAANLRKMTARIALTDADRLPWLRDVGRAIAASDAPCVVACSALKFAYREHLRDAAQQPLAFVHLTAPEAILRARLSSREGHFMPPELLHSQLDTLEPLRPDEAGLRVEVSAALPDLLVDVVTGLRALGHAA